MSTLPDTECRALQVSADDNVATLLVSADVGAAVRIQGQGDGARIEAVSAIPFGHKIALTALDEGDTVVKYGQAIGRATVAIPKGHHVHTHNVVGDRGRKDMQRLGDDTAGLLAEAGDHC